MRRVFQDRRGAMFLMGIPIAMLMIAMLYFAIGLGEQIVLRERMQDAADAGALSAAIMEARGMNMIALVNQVMAAVVALLVMVRLLQVVMLAAAAIGTALAFWTGGASLAIVPPATSAAAEAEDAFDALQNITTPIIRGLHVFELGLKYAMPVAAEARVVDTVRGHYNPPASFGFAIPGHFPLPVVDGKWPDLCGRAGGYAADMINWPIESIIGSNPVSDFIHDGVSGLAHSFSGMFCNPNSAAEGLSIPKKTPPIKLDHTFVSTHPVLASITACKSADTKSTPEAREQACEEASLATTRATPGTDGNPNTACTYVSPRDQQPHTCEPCRGPDGQPCAEFKEMADNAAEECRDGGGLEVSKWNYQRRDYSLRINLVPVPLVQPQGEPLDVPEPEDWPYTIEVVPGQPAHIDTYVDKAPDPPCGEHGHIGKGYNPSANYHANGQYDEDQLLCEQDHLAPDVDALVKEAGAGTPGLPLSEWRARFDDPTFSEDSEPYEPARPADLDPGAPWPPAYLKPPYVPKERPFFVGRWAGVTFLHSCGTTVDNFDDLEMEQPPDANAAPPPGNPNDCGQGSMIHHVMEPGHELGSEVFQLRAVVTGSTEREQERDIVRLMPYRFVGEGRSGSGGVSQALELASKVFVAQAEYYYDTGWNEKEQHVEEEDTEWLWNMNWRARLRRFRLPTDRDDDSSSGGMGDDAQGCNFETPSPDVVQSCLDAGKKDQPAAGQDSNGEQCPQQSGGFLDSLSDLADTVLVH